MNESRAKKIRKMMADMGYVKEDLYMFVKRTAKKEIQVPAKTLLGVPVPGSGLKTEFVDVPIYELRNTYKRVFKAIAKGEFDFETRQIKK